MSSATRSLMSIPTSSQTLQPDFVNMTTLCYVDNGLNGEPIPVPFIYRNGELDINIQDNVYDDLISGNGTIVPLNINLVRQMGGKGYVQRLGPNFLRWLENEFAGTNFKVHTPGTVTKVATNTNQGGNPYYDWVLGQYGALGLTDVEPSSDKYIFTGTPENNYGTVWVFLQPLTVSFYNTDTSVTNYIVFNTTFTKNIPFAP